MGTLVLLEPVLPMFKLTNSICSSTPLIARGYVQCVAGLIWPTGQRGQYLLVNVLLLPKIVCRNKKGVDPVIGRVAYQALLTKRRGLGGKIMQ